jgi:hypothetical protein
MKRFVITEDEKNHISKMYGLIYEQATNPVCDKFVMVVPLKNPDPETGLNWSKDKVLAYSAIYTEPMSGGKLNAKDGGGNRVWLHSKGFLDWPAGNTKLAYTAAKKLYDGISGLDISGEGAKKIAEVAQMWKSFDILTQNEFLKQWYKLTQGSETPWEAIASDNEEKFRDMMVNDSTSKVKKYCPASVYY